MLYKIENIANPITQKFNTVCTPEQEISLEPMET